MLTFRPQVHVPNCGILVTQIHQMLVVRDINISIVVWCRVIFEYQEKMKSSAGGCDVMCWHVVHRFTELKNRVLSSFYLFWEILIHVSNCCILVAQIDQMLVVRDFTIIGSPRYRSKLSAINSPRRNNVETRRRLFSGEHFGHSYCRASGSGR